MQVELPIDKALARYVTTDGARIVKQAFETAFKRMMPNAGAPGALSQAEADLLDASGLVEPADATVAFDVAGESAAEQAALFATALTVESAARLLGLNPSRVRQQIGARELYAMRHGRTWRLPQFQFLVVGGETRRVPNAGPVFKALPGDLSGIAVARWFTSPNDELRVSEEAPATSPRDWLAQGHPPQAAVRLATELAGEPQGEPLAGTQPVVEELTQGIAALQAAGDERALRALSRTIKRMNEKGAGGG